MSRTLSRLLTALLIVALAATGVAANADAQATTLEFEDAPPATTTDRHASFVFNQDTTATCHLDGEAYEPCASPVFVLDLALGNHTFTVATTTGATIEHEWVITSIFDEASDDLLPASRQPADAEQNSWRGIFRINCDFSHSSYNDPIVFPGQEGAAHLHRFYGHTEVDHLTTVESLYSTGSSTCQGGELNRSAYWVPALLTPHTNDAEWAAVPAVVGGDDVAHEVFYYSAAVDDLDSIQPIPAGLRMVAGDPSATPDNPQDTSIVRWHCQSWEANDRTNPQFSATIPECEAPDRLRLDIFFPSCWNGTDLDSADHTSHMSYPVQEVIDGTTTTVCPDSHPVPIIRPSYHYAFGVKPAVFDPETASSSRWRLSSDAYTVTSELDGGASIHADWFNGWHPEVMEAILETCIQDALDCHDGNLANGFRLGDVSAGVQNEPQVINGGLGDHSMHSHDAGEHETATSDMPTSLDPGAAETERDRPPRPTRPSRPASPDRPR